MSGPVFTDKENDVQFRVPPKTPLLKNASSGSHDSTLRGHKTPLRDENQYASAKSFNGDAKDSTYAGARAHLVTPTARVPLGGKDNNSNQSAVNTKLSFNVSHNDPNVSNDSKNDARGIVSSVSRAKINGMGQSSFNNFRPRALPQPDFDFLRSTPKAAKPVHIDNEHIDVGDDILMKDDIPNASVQVRNYDDEIEYMPPKMQELPYVPLDCVTIDYEAVGKHLRERTLSGLHSVYHRDDDEGDDEDNKNNDNGGLDTEMMMKRLPVNFIEEDIVVNEERPYLSSSPERKECFNRLPRPLSAQDRFNRVSELKLRSIQAEFPPSAMTSLPHFMTATKSAELKRATRAPKPRINNPVVNKPPTSPFQNSLPLPRHRLTRDVIHKPVHQRKSTFSVYTSDSHTSDVESLEPTRFPVRNTVELTSDDDRMFHFDV